MVQDWPPWSHYHRSRPSLSCASPTTTGTSSTWRRSSDTHTTGYRRGNWYRQEITYGKRCARPLTAYGDAIRTCASPEHTPQLPRNTNKQYACHRVYSAFLYSDGGGARRPGARARGGAGGAAGGAVW